METVEITGATVKEAVERGMRQLNVTSPSQVMVEVLEDPDEGPARVRLVFMGIRAGEQVTSITNNPLLDERPRISSSPTGTTQIVANPYVPPPEPEPEYTDDDAREEEDDESIIFLGSEYEPVSDDDASEAARVGQQVVRELLQRMQIDATVGIFRIVGGPRREAQYVLNIMGENVGRLIGKHGDTLTSLQYVVRLIVSRRMQQRPDVLVDVDGYRSQKADRLIRMAHRLADQAVERHEVVLMEPMSSNDRRMVHMTLRKRKDVTTRSVGKGDARKVTIAPAK